VQAIKQLHTNDLAELQITIKCIFLPMAGECCSRIVLRHTRY